MACKLLKVILSAAGQAHWPLASLASLASAMVFSTSIVLVSLVAMAMGTWCAREPRMHANAHYD